MSGSLEGCTSLYSFGQEYWKGEEGGAARFFPSSKGDVERRPSTPKNQRERSAAQRSEFSESSTDGGGSELCSAPGLLRCPSPAPFVVFLLRATRRRNSCEAEAMDLAARRTASASSSRPVLLRLSKSSNINSFETPAAHRTATRTCQSHRTKLGRNKVLFLSLEIPAPSTSSARSKSCRDALSSAASRACKSTASRSQAKPHPSEGKARARPSQRPCLSRRKKTYRQPVPLAGRYACEERLRSASPGTFSLHFLKLLSCVSQDELSLHDASCFLGGGERLAWVGLALSVHLKLRLEQRLRRAPAFPLSSF